MLNKFSINLKRLLKDYNLTQKQLANILDTKQQNISRWCKGKYEPNFEIFIKICLIFDVDANYLLGFDEISNNIKNEYKLNI